MTETGNGQGHRAGSNPVFTRIRAPSIGAPSVAVGWSRDNGDDIQMTDDVDNQRQQRYGSMNERTRYQSPPLVSPIPSYGLSGREPRYYVNRPNITTTPSFYQGRDGMSISTPDTWSYVQSLEDHRSRIDATIQDLQPLLNTPRVRVATPPTVDGRYRFEQETFEAIAHPLDRLTRVYNRIPTDIDGSSLHPSTVTGGEFIANDLQSTGTRGSRADAEPDDDDARPIQRRPDAVQVETVISQQTSVPAASYHGTVHTLFPPPDRKQELIADRQQIWKFDSPTEIPVRMYYHSRSFRRRPNARKAYCLWRIEIQEAYTGAFREWSFLINPGMYEFECCGQPIVLFGCYNGVTHMFAFPLLMSSTFAEAGYTLPLQQQDCPDPGFLSMHLSRSYRIGGFLHPWIYGVPGNHEELLKGSGRRLYLPHCVFSGEGTQICQSFAAAKCRSIVAGYFSQPRGEGSVTAHDSEAALFAKAASMNIRHCTTPPGKWAWISDTAPAQAPGDTNIL